MKPKRNKNTRNTKRSQQKVELGVINRRRNKGHGPGTLISSLQALLSIAMEIFHSLRSLTDSFSWLLHATCQT
jgi:hypothetical protein